MGSLYVICKISDTEYAIPADEVYQLESYVEATPVPGAPAYVAGLVQVRQQIIPVLDLRARFSLPVAPRGLEARIVVLSLGERHVGVVVDSAREVHEISAEQFRAPPELVMRQSGGFVKSVAQLKDRIIMLLDMEKIVGEEVKHA